MLSAGDLNSAFRAPVRSPLAAMLPALSAGGGHGPAASPVADGVVLRPAEPPVAAQVGADRADGGGLGGDPGEHVVSVGAVQAGHGIDEQRALARRRATAVQPPKGDAR